MGHFYRDARIKQSSLVTTDLHEELVCVSKSVLVTDENQPTIILIVPKMYIKTKTSESVNIRMS